MKVEELQELKRKIELLKKRRDMAEGSMANILKGWEQEFNIRNLEEAKELSNKLEQEIAVCQERMDKCAAKIEEAVDWEDLD